MNPALPVQEHMAGLPGRTTPGAACFMAQVRLCSNNLGMAMAQSTYATDAGGVITAMRQLLDRVELKGLLVQAEALHANRPFPLPRGARRRLLDRRETLPP